MRHERLVYYPFAKELSRFQGRITSKTPFMPFGTVPIDIGLSAKVKKSFETSKFFNKKVKECDVLE